MKDGTPRRLPRVQAEAKLKTGEAKRYISKTVYKALSLGIEVKNPNTRDEKGELKAQIRALTEKKAKREAKKAKEKAEE
jgi:hypothetical protein